MSQEHPCCPPGSLPKLHHTTENKGKIEFIGGYNNYIVGDSPRTIILIYDIFGLTGGRTKDLADTIASFGYTVVVPDPLKGDYWKEDAPLGPELFAWMAQKKLDDFEMYFQNFLLLELAEREKTEFAIIGSCYGVWVAARLAAICKELKVLVGFHPSLQVEELQGGSIKTLLEKITQPTLLFPASNDPANIKEGGEYIALLKEKTKGKTEVYSMETVPHGFMNRGDLNDPVVKKAYDETLTTTKEFLTKYF